MKFISHFITFTNYVYILCQNNFETYFSFYYSYGRCIYFYVIKSNKFISHSVTFTDYIYIIFYVVTILKLISHCITVGIPNAG